jgi:hypothetical protein
MRRVNPKLASMMPGMTARAVSASRQLSDIRMAIAMMRRIIDSDGDTTAICSSPLVVSTSPVSRDRMPPVFMSHSFESGKCRRRSNNDRRSESITFTFSSFCR